MRTKHFFDHLILLIGVAVIVGPVAITLFSSTHSGATLGKDGLQFLPGPYAAEVYGAVLFEGRGFSKSVTGLSMALNSLYLALGFALAKVTVSLLAAYALVFFRVRFGTFFFWVILCSLLLPLESRFLPTYAVISKLGLVNTYPGLMLPLLASAVGTFFFRQFFLGIPVELSEAARIDGAGPIKFLKDVLVPSSAPMIAALGLLMFVQGWNQYLWPIMVSSEESRMTLVQGLSLIGRTGPQGLALAVLAMLPPILLVIFCQKAFVKGLTDGRH
ncbi:ABC transporter permease subunit [Pseudovibrio sp. Tun.PSC04-5.I4]|uniref:ABC transporter permease subunit n=1 Tax=Pseudovibrio sp. Tun.PSC04-5.I4 TaxID=1798213 RepID=UPI00088F52A8|nr:ABC transporter permease subunit [Pseudovibrio sp. Tun.PSC04-5.I4]SDR27526.1 carbohydrate ABC transporter membrane protein 2, CUT1 family [Pseudovibrio sp. Tun.PSC04-5.I4]